MSDSAIELGIRIFIALCGLFVLAGALGVLYGYLKAKFFKQSSAIRSNSNTTQRISRASAESYSTGGTGSDTVELANQGEMNMGFELSNAAVSITDSYSGDETSSGIDNSDTGVSSGGDFGGFGGDGDSGGGGSSGGWD